METNNEMIPIDLQLFDFKQYLEANSRCILSAKFGNGKSYFIGEFIKKYSNEYLFIPIYPVNYQVMDNKDIFELIKRDILIRLLSNDVVSIDNLNFSTSFLCYHYFINNATDSLLDILELIPSVNLLGVDINIGNVLKKTNEIKRKYEIWKKSITENIKDKTNVYIEHFNEIKGSIYEFDAISQLISDIIKEYKNNNRDKKVVLIIEDLDRIDPAHIFRILNVFSAHFDRYNITTSSNMSSVNSINKFCLDKIVSVCDLDNIKNIYAHVYGKGTDFDGYISKFTNSKVFRYSLHGLLKDYIISILLNKYKLDYPHLCNYLADKIIGSAENEDSTKKNLRIIKERILNSKSLIKKKEIHLEKPIDNIYVTTDSNFIFLLSLFKTFDIDFVTQEASSELKKELIFIIGKYWILAGKFNKNMYFEVDGSFLHVYYKDKRHDGKEDWVKGHSFFVEINNNELININMSSININRNVLVSKFYDVINDIMSFLSKEAIIL